MNFSFQFISCFLIINLISSSTANLVNRLINDIQDVSIDETRGDIWVVLVAGSNGYFNYRSVIFLIYFFNFYIF